VTTIPQRPPVLKHLATIVEKTPRVITSHDGCDYFRSAPARWGAEASTQPDHPSKGSGHAKVARNAWKAWKGIGPKPGHHNSDWQPFTWHRWQTFHNVDGHNGSPAIESWQWRSRLRCREPVIKYHIILRTDPQGVKVKYLGRAS
jgi:hypothetical protein